MGNLGFGRLIGRKNLPEGSDSSGLWKLNTQHYLRSINRWFSNDYSVSPNTSNINEGQTVTFTTTTVGVPNGTTLYYTISGNVTASDFSNGSLSGSFVINSNTGSVALTASTDYVTEGSESFVFQLRAGSTSGPIVATSSTVTINDTTLTPSYTITPSNTTINEGSSVTFSISTTNLPDGTTLYYTLNSVSGTVNSSDFSSGSLSGSVTISGSSASISYTLSNDLTTGEGNESFQIQLRTGSISGTVVVTSTTVTITDSSAVTYAVSPSVSSITEGSSVTFNVTTLNVPDSTTLYYTISPVSGSVTADDFTSNSLSGNFTINSNAGSVTLTASTSTTNEGSESFQLQIRIGSITGTVVATSTTVTITEPSVSITTSGALTSDTGGYRYHVYTGPGTFTINSTSTLSVDYLVVAGGGGGGGGTPSFASYFGAGGGAGGFRTGTGFSLIGPQQFTITVGAGGNGGNPGSVAGAPGSNSTFSTIASSGGGGTSFGSGLSGGSGGGGGQGVGNPSSYPTPFVQPGGTGNPQNFTPPEGRPGGSGGYFNIPTSTSWTGFHGGGGGSSGTGGNGSYLTAGSGGSGSYSPYGATLGYGSPSGYFSGGGGGWGGAELFNNPYTSSSRFPGSGGSGGSGGGGRGGSAMYSEYLTPPGDGPGGTIPNPNFRTSTPGGQYTGGGGGGGGDWGPSAPSQNQSGGQGGSGIVIIRYLWPV